MAVLYKNNAASSLASGINTTATSIVLVSGGGAKFPAPTGSDFFYLTILDGTGNFEIVKVTVRTTDTLTVVRAQEGTTALSFSTGVLCELRITGGLLDQFKTDTASGITSSNVTNALGFTPYNASNPSGFITGITSGNVTTALGFTPYNATNPSGFISGITSGMVTTALGYTPYNSSNPSGYITGITSGMVTTALGFTPYNNSNPSGYITSAALSPYLTAASAASTYLTSATAASTYAPLTGTGASGTWGINITGSAGSATSATTAGSTTYLAALGIYVWSASTNGRSFNSGIQTSFVQSSNGYPSYGSVVRVATYPNDGATAELYFPYSSTYGGSAMQYRLGQYDNAGWTGWKTVIDSSNYTNYAATVGHNHTYDVNNAWLRDANDDANVKLYGNTRQMVFRTDGTTEFASGIGGYAFAWMYGGDSAAERRMLLASNGRLWTNYHGWMDEAFAPLSHVHSYLLLSGGALTGNVTLNTSDGEILVTPTGWRSSDRAAIKIRSKANTPAEIDLRHTVGGVESGWHISARDTSAESELHLYRFNMTSAGAADAAGSFLQMFTFKANGGFNSAGAITQAGNQVLHAGNVGTYALPLSGDATRSGTTTLSGVTVFNNYISLGGDFYHNGNQYILNPAQNGWINIVNRNGGSPFINNVTYSGNAILHAGNYNSYSPTLTGGGASGTWGINISGSAATASTASLATAAIRIQYNDGPRDLSDRLPNSFTRTVNFDFVGAGTGNGSGNYAGVMTFSPWTGTTASTGDSSYQLSFANTTGVNASGQPKLSIRNGIDSTWNAWYTLLHSGNVGTYALPISGGTILGRVTFQDSSDTQITLNGNGTAWTGITATDSGGTDYLWIYGATGTWSFGGGGSPVSGKKMHIHGGVTIGSGYTQTSNPSNGLNVEGAIQQAGNQVLHAGNYTSYANAKGGGWYGSGLPGTRWGGYSASGGEISFGDGLPNAAQMGILVDGCYVAGENNGFWSMGSDNTWGSRRGMYWDGTYLNFTTNSATASFTNALIGGNQVFHVGNYTSYNGIIRALGYPSGGNNWDALGNDYHNSVIQVDPSNFSSTANGPTAASYQYGTLLNLASNSSSKSQIYISHAGNDLIFRGGWGTGSWQTWNKVLTNQNYNSYSPTLTGGNASGTWGINVTGTAGSISGFNNPTTAATANTIVYRDSNAHITGNYILGSYFNSSGGNSENPTIGQVWTQSTGDNYLRKSTPAHFISQLGLLTTSNYSSYALPTSGGTVGDLRTNFTSGGGGHTFSANHYSMGKDIANGGWSHPHYSDLIIGYHTGIRLGASYSGIRFYNNSPTTDANNDGNGDGGEALLMTVGGHAGGSNVIINNNLWLSNSNLSLGQGDGTALRVTTAYGYMNFGPQNTSWCHLYSDRPFYTNQGIWINNNRVLDASNYTSYSPSLGGSGASGTWGINVTGSAGSSNVMGSSGYGNGTHTWRQESGTFAGYSGWASYLISNHGDGDTYYSQTIIMPFWGAPQYSRKQGSSAVVGPYTFLTTENYTSYSPTLTGGSASGTWGIAISGNAARATRANGNFYIDDNYGNGVVGVYSSYRYQTVYAMGDSYKMSADGTSLSNMYGMAWSHPNAGGAAGNLTDHGLLIINAGGFRCAISNSIVASANITAYSDERLKTNWRDMPEDYVTRLAQVKVGIYDRTDQEDVTQVGVSAQSFQELLPQAIMTAKDEMQTLSVNYGGAALASSVELAKRVVDQEKRIAHLESLINKLIGD